MSAPTRKKYVVQLKERGKWTDTEWTNDNPHGDDDPAPIEPRPVSKARASKALMHAHECYPKLTYRIAEAGSR